MEEKSKRRRINQNPRIGKINDSGRPAGLAKSKKIIRAMNEKETPFLKLCSQIRLENCKKDKAENQRTERKAKRN